MDSFSSIATIFLVENTKKIQERRKHFKRKVYYFLEFQTHPQVSIYRALQTLTFLCVCVKITKAEKGSDFWLPFCLCELMDTVGQMTAALEQRIKDVLL